MGRDSVCEGESTPWDVKLATPSVCRSLGATLNSAGQLQSQRWPALLMGLALNMRVRSYPYSGRKTTSRFIPSGGEPEVEGFYLMSSVRGQSGLLRREVRRRFKKKDFKELLMGGNWDGASAGPTKWYLDECISLHLKKKFVCPLTNTQCPASLFCYHPGFLR